MAGLAGCTVSGGGGRLIHRQLCRVPGPRRRLGPGGAAGEEVGGQCQRLIGSLAVTLDPADPIRGDRMETHKEFYIQGWMK